MKTNIPQSVPSDLVEGHAPHDSPEAAAPAVPAAVLLARALPSLALLAVPLLDSWFDWFSTDGGSGGIGSSHRPKGT